PHERRRRRHGLPPVPDPQLRQGAADADQAAGQRRAHDADPRSSARGVDVRGVLIVLAATGILFATAAPAAPPEYPVSFIKVDELTGLLAPGTQAHSIDVARWEAHPAAHHKGARA